MIEHTVESLEIGINLFSISRPVATSDRHRCLQRAHSARGVPLAVSPRAGFAVIVVTALASVILAGPVNVAAAAEQATALTVTGPVIHSDAPDPSLLVVGHSYYAFTTDSGGNNLPVYKSTDLVDWQLVGDAMPILPSWAEIGFSWSPSVTVAPGGGYQLFYDAYDDADGAQCIGRATSTSPLGPFVDSSSTPFLCQQALGGSIDASVFQRSGGDVLVWKSDRIAGIWAQSLGSDDTRVTGLRHLLLSPTASWEEGVVEGPAMLHSGSTVTLWFSAGIWSGPSYSIGRVVCDSPLGPCDAGSATQVLKTDGTLVGPGGPSFFDSDDSVEMAFSAWVGKGRAMYLATVGSDAGSVAPSSSLRSATSASQGQARTVSDAGGVGR
jgi:hypothetical protein